MTEADLKKLTLAGARGMIARGEISPLELTEAVIARTERLNPEVRAFITVMKDEALDAARLSERRIAGSDQPSLLGIPLSVKDLYDTKGVKTTAGAKIFDSRVPREDATVVKKLGAAGAINIGKANMHEFAFGVTTVNAHYGTVRNPWDKERIAGGSSGGSASAVALGLGLGSVGSDTGGSIRIPAALCGIAGLKPTYGRVSLRGIIPLSWSLDHPGPLAQTVEDVAILLGVIAGHDPKDQYSRNVGVPLYSGVLTGNIKGVRIGIPKTHFYEGLAPEVDTAMRQALKNIEKLGARVIDVSLPKIPVHRAVWLHIASPEAYSYHETFLKTQAGQYGPDVRGRLEAGRMLLSIDYVRAQRVRTIMKEECKAIFGNVDVVITPTVPIPAPRIDDLHKPWGNGPETAAACLARFTRYFNILGLPAISIPCGFTSEGLPLGMQIAGKAFDESMVLRVAHAYEQDARWFERRPAM